MRCDGIVTIVRLAIVVAMQLLLSCMPCAVVLAAATGLRPASYTWCLHSDQRYIPFPNRSKHSCMYWERNRNKSRDHVCVTCNDACIAPENDVGATSYQTSPFSGKKEAGEKQPKTREENLPRCKEKLRSRAIENGPAVAQAKRVHLREAQESQGERVAGESAGGIIPRDWQMEKRRSQRSSATILRRSEARRRG